MNIEQLATELLNLREEIARLETREKEVREEMETLLVSTLGNRFHAADHDFTLVPPGSTSQLNETLLREVLATRNLSEAEINEILQAATKTSPRDGYLRVTGGGKD